MDTKINLGDGTYEVQGTEDGVPIRRGTRDVLVLVGGVCTE